MLTTCFQKDIIPVVEHFLSNATVVQNTLELLTKIIGSELVITSPVVSFIAKMLPVGLCFVILT